MSQGSVVVPTSGTVSGLTMANDINAALDAIRTCWAGGSAPAADTPEEGQLWLNTSTTLPTLNQYTGSGWAPVAVIDTTNNIWLPTYGPVKTTTGIGSAYVLSTGYAPAALIDGQSLRAVFNVANTGTCTINVNGLGAVHLQSAVGVDLQANSIVASAVYDLTYNASGGVYLLDGFYSGSAPVPSGVSLEYHGYTAPSGYFLEYGQAVARTNASLMAAISITQTGTFTISAKTLTGMTDTSNMRVGFPIESASLSPGTTIASIVSSTAITVSANATVSGSASFTVFPHGNGDGSTTFNVPEGRGYVSIGSDWIGGTAAQRSQITTTTITTTLSSASATVSTAAGLAIGMYVMSTNVPVGATITAISGTTITLSQNATASASTVAARFSPLTDAQILGASGGAMTHTQVASEMVSHTHTISGTVSGTTSGQTADHYHFYYQAYSDGTPKPTSGGTAPYNQQVYTNTGYTSNDHQHNFSGSFSGTSGSAGSGLPMIIIPPLRVVNRIIKI
jgi:microcystin-dependent protein